jgi:uncharacterized protein YecE (DUF72 family)
MSSILVGTASWTDKSLIDTGGFYPPTVKSAEERLKFYSSEFPIVEVDSSYYALPAPQNAQLWAERTPQGFTFNVKAFRLFTGHQTDPKVLPKDIREALGPVEAKYLYYRDVPEELRDELWNRFREALEPLRAAGKLGAVHFQFPPWFTYRSDSFHHIKECIAKLQGGASESWAKAEQGYLMATEFRHASWFEGKHLDGTLRFERERRLVHVVVDSPQGPRNSVPAVWEAADPDLVIVRLHGRNHETWNMKGLTSSADRFNYDYRDEELADIAEKIHTLSRTVARVHVLFNNNNGDQAQRNGKTLTTIIMRWRQTE